MKTNDFYYELPDEAIAYKPSPERDGCRLLVLKRDSRSIEHKFFYDLPGLLKEGDVLVLNDTKVIPARLIGRKQSGLKQSGQKVEMLLLKMLGPRLWTALMKGPKNGLKIEFPNGLSATMQKFGEHEWVAEFSRDCDGYIQDHGSMPLPPYIKREPTESDKTDYQTVYARHEGAVAAPTAGLHMTDALLGRLKKMGVELIHVTLHVGIGTFRPVKTENIEDHTMESEFRTIDEAAAKSVNRAKEEGRRVIAVGTTVVRTLESGVDKRGRLLAQVGATDKFIVPGYDFKLTDCLITNFHAPRSTLLMLTSALAGREFVLSAYKQALDEHYRFLSYGDAMIIL